MAGIFWATGILMISSFIQLAIYRLKSGKFERSKILLFLAIMLFGGLTLLFHNDAFIKWKVTIVCLLFSLAFLLSPYFGSKTYLIKKLLSSSGENLSMVPEQKWKTINNFWIFSYLLQAAGNHYFAFYSNQEAWVNYKVWGLTSINFVLIIISMVLIAPFINDESNQIDSPSVPEKSETSAKDENDH